MSTPDPGFLTDGTGDGIFGGMDVSLDTQKKLKETVYNGTTPCNNCGLQLNPFQALQGDLCPKCNKKQASRLIKNRMVG